jgi:hypothetical protein
VKLRLKIKDFIKEFVTLIWLLYSGPCSLRLLYSQPSSFFSLTNVKEKNVSCLLRSLLRREGMQNEKCDSSSFAELGSLVRMNDWKKFT